MTFQQSEFGFEADPRAFLAGFAAAHPVAPSVGLVAASQADQLLEIRSVRALLARPGNLSSAFATTDGARLYAREIAETLVSVAGTASLAAFLRDGEDWRIEGIPAGSRRALRLLAELHLLRSDLAHRAPDTSRFLNSRTGNNFSERLRRAYALLLLSLDVVDGKLKGEAIHSAEIGRTGDPQGDAQLACEEHLAEPRMPLWIDADE